MRQRLADIAIASIGAAVAAPLMAAIGLLVFASSGWPVFFRQTRVGRHGLPFTLVKFRTMALNHGGGPLTPAGHPAVTRMGAFLRATKLDELPQLWNILRGDMSLIGPRPELPQFVSEFVNEFEPILAVRPGLLDAASLAFYDEPRLLAQHADPVSAYRRVILPQKLQLSANYLQTRTLGSDVKLLWQTLAKWRRVL